jgi:signal transduction histidine kinase
MLVAATLVLGLLMHAYLPYTGMTALFGAVWLAPFRMPLWQALALAVTAIAGFLGISFVEELPGSAIGGIGAALGWPVLFAAVVNQLAITKSQSAELAAARVLAERQRLAREIHDVLAHSLAAQVVHLEATPLADELAGLAEQFRVTTGNPCVVEVSGDASVLPPETRLAVVRTAQEAFTNVHKHAPDASVRVVLRCAGDRCELEVSDTGGRPGTLSSAGNGFGLVGMRERAELLGGELTAGPSGAGFRVLLKVPA